MRLTLIFTLSILALTNILLGIALNLQGHVIDTMDQRLEILETGVEAP